jgi:hypothetical protein
MNEPGHRSDLPPEVELVLLLSTPQLRPEEAERLRELTPALLDWNRVFGMLVLHRTAGVAWRNIVDHGLHGQNSFRAAYALTGLQMLYDGQRIAVGEQIDRNVGLIEEFDRRGVPCVVLKGAVVARTAYRHLGMRVFNDNDYLVRRGQLAQVGAALKELGYIQGLWNPSERRVVPATRSEALLHPTTAHDTYPYSMATPDAAVLPHHGIDVHFSIDLLTSNNNDDVVDDLLDRRTKVGLDDGRWLWAPHPDDMFVFVCVHFQREACNRREVETVKDLVLYKLVDLLGLLDSKDYPVDLSGVAQRARRLGLAREVYFALVYLDALFPGRVPAGVIEELRPESTEYLDQVVHNGAPIHTWRQPRLARFFDPRRAAELAGR